MRSKTINRRIVAALTALAMCALMLPLAAQASSKNGPPRVTTGGVGALRGTSGLLEGTVNPRGHETTYFFEYGPTTAYGTKTPVATLPAGTTVVKVGVTVNNLVLGEDYRLVASNEKGTNVGLNKKFEGKKVSSRFSLDKENLVDVYGTPYYVTGTLGGASNAGRSVVLQSSPYPFLEPFVTISTPAITTTTGAFSFRVTRLTAATQFRVATVEPRPLYSPTITVKVAVKVTLHVRRSATTGLYRLYGTVTPAVGRVRILFQLKRNIRPTKSEKTVAWGTQLTTKTIKGGTVSHFSTFARIARQGFYRAYVEMPAGPLTSGNSSAVYLHAVAGGRKK